MARTPSPTLTDAELRLMRVLWDRGPSTSAGLVEALAPRVRLSDSSVRTILRVLERKGYIRHRKEGRAFVYQARVREAEVRRGVVRHLVSRFFRDSPEALVLNVLEHEAVDREELARLRRRLGEDER